MASPAGSNAGPAVATITEVVSTLTTYCSEYTTFVTNGATYTATGPTTLTVTDCPCTVTRSSITNGWATNTGAVVASVIPGGSSGYYNTTVASAGDYQNGTFTTTMSGDIYTVSTTIGQNGTSTGSYSEILRNETISDLGYGTMTVTSSAPARVTITEVGSVAVQETGPLKRDVTSQNHYLFSTSNPGNRLTVHSLLALFATFVMML